MILVSTPVQSDWPFNLIEPDAEKRKHDASATAQHMCINVSCERTSLNSKEVVH